MDLPTIWFIAIAILWTGYFVLEGFDFGVGALLPLLGRDNTDRRVMINSIGPVWDGNEVWLITAVGAMFAAFPAWYASLLSGFYLPMLAILLALIARGVAFEYRGKVDTPRWRAAWDRAIFWGSVIPAFLWGAIFANLVRGVPMDERHVVTAGLLDLVNPYALLGGLTTLALFTLHGAVFLSLKTDGAVRTRARHATLASALIAVPAAQVFLLWTQWAHGGWWTLPLAALAASALVLGVLFTTWRREGRAFAATAVGIAATAATLFTALFPDVLPSTTSDAYSLTVANGSSADYTLTVMSWVALVFLPVVIGYQAWTYWVFRKRLSRADIEPAPDYGPEPSDPGGAIAPPRPRTE